MVASAFNTRVNCNIPATIPCVNTLMKISKGLHIAKCHYIGNKGPLYRTCDIPASILWINIYTKALYFPIQWLAPYTVDNNIQKIELFR